MVTEHRSVRVRTLLDELAQLSGENHRLADNLHATFDRAAQIEGRLRVYDEVLPQLFSQIRQEVIIRHAYERYLPSHLTRALATEPGRIGLDGELRRVTILFADFRQFTQTASRMHPQDVVRVLNSYFTQMSGIISKYEGSIDKFLGDGFMAIFGAPVPLENNSLQAVRAALEIQQFLAISNGKKAEPAGFRLPMGIGINEGEAVIGSVGSPERMDHTAIGDTVNVAARLTGVARPGQVVLGYSVARAVRSHVRVVPLPPTTMKGKRRPIRTYLALPDEG